MRPKVIDFDLYLPKRGVPIDSTPNRRAVRALHRRGGYAICYVDAGSIESYRPDYPRFVRWHRRHGHALAHGAPRCGRGRGGPLGAGQRDH